MRTRLVLSTASDIPILFTVVCHVCVCKHTEISDLTFVVLSIIRSAIELLQSSKHASFFGGYMAHTPMRVGDKLSIGLVFLCCLMYYIIINKTVDITYYCIVVAPLNIIAANCTASYVSNVIYSRPYFLLVYIMLVLVAKWFSRGGALRLCSGLRVVCAAFNCIRLMPGRRSGLWLVCCRS